MSHITLTQEQINILTSSGKSLEVRDTQGLLLGHIQPSDDAIFIALAKKRRASKKPGIPSKKVLAVLQSLDNADEQGASGEELRELSKRLIEEVSK